MECRGGLCSYRGSHPTSYPVSGRPFTPFSQYGMLLAHPLKPLVFFRYVAHAGDRQPPRLARPGAVPPMSTADCPGTYTSVAGSLGTLHGSLMGEYCGPAMWALDQPWPKESRTHPAMRPGPVAEPCRRTPSQAGRCHGLAELATVHPGGLQPRPAVSTGDY